jgi:hypothetical protein
MLTGTNKYALLLTHFSNCYIAESRKEKFMERQTVLHIRTTEKQKKWLKFVAEKNDVTMTELINYLITKKREELVDDKKRFIER